MIQSEIYIKDYLQIFMRRRWVIMTIFTVIVVSTLLWTLRQKPVYQATAVMLIERQKPNVVSVQEVAPGIPTDYYAYKDYYETQNRVIRSRTLMKNVANSLGLKIDESKNGKDPVKKLSKAVRVNPVRNSQLLEVNAEDTNPEMAAKIANAVVDEYIKESMERNITATGGAAEWLSKKIEEQRKKLSDSEIALQKYREKYNISTLPQLSESTTTVEAVEDIKSEYAKQQALYANYSERYTDEHPKMVELRAQINSLKNKIQGLEDIDMGNKTMEYRMLEREVQTNKQMYEILAKRMKEIDVSGNMNVNNISVIDRAEVPKKPIKPDLKYNMFVAVLLGGVLAIGSGFFIDYMDTTIKSPDDIKQILGAHFIGAVTNVEGVNDADKDKVVHMHPKSPVSELYRTIRTEVCRLMSLKENAKTLLITSAEPQAGKTMTISNLAIALSQLGKNVVIVDADLRKPQLNRVFKLSRDWGLTDYLLDGTDVDSIIKNTGIENLKVITSGRIPRNPAEIIALPKMDKFISELKSRFDYVLFDSPPIISVTDGIILLSKLDALAYVVRSGKAPVPVVLRAKEQLERAKGKFLGVILNDLKTYHGDYYYYKYYHYYGEDGRRSSRHGAEHKDLDAVESLTS